MLNPKQLHRKKSQIYTHNKEQPKDSEAQLKRKKSLTNLAVSSKLKKQSGDKEQKNTKKIKQEKKLIHSLSKGKISKKHHKSQRNDQNVNNMNHKRSVEKIQPIGKISKEIMKSKKNSDDFPHQKKQEKFKSIHTEQNLAKVNSEVKLNNVKKIQKKKPEYKQPVQQKYLSKNQQKFRQNQQLEKNFSSHVTKSLARNPTSKKNIAAPKTKLKKSTTLNHQQSRKSTRQKLKTNTKIAEIIQKSILYSDVNYDFKQQMSFLGSGIKKEEDFFMPYPYQSSHLQSDFGMKQMNDRRRLEHQAAITIQRHFRGYIQRKYIQQARYIIDCIKKIQRFWRDCLRKKKENQRLKNKKQNKKDTDRGQIQNSLITVKDFNDISKLQRKQSTEIEENTETRKLSQDDLNKEALKEIIKNLLSEENLNENIKEKIRTAMINEHKMASLQQKLSSKQLKQIPKTEDMQKKPIKGPSSMISQLSINNESHIDSHSKQFYVQKKISMQISSQRNFNSPMNNNQFLTSPGVKRLTSPKSLSSSFSKEVKSNYTNYFKSTKNAVFSSPNGKEDNAHRLQRSHSGSKKEKQVICELISHDEAKLRDTDKVDLQKQLDKQPKRLSLTKEDYLFNADICLSSPILQCQQQSPTNIKQDLNLFGQKNQQLQTRRVFKSTVTKPFPTEFCFIEEFCLLITDYLREDEETTEIFLEKIKGLKFFKIEKIFKEWERLQFEEYWSDNQPLRAMILKEHFERPTIFSKTQKSLLLEYPSLRLFLNQNDYPDQQLTDQSSPKSAYIKFMFDVFEECIYQNFRNINIKDFTLLLNKQNRRNIDYMSVILSQAMGNMLKSAQMLCGSFESDDMTEVEKQERQLMNDMRLGEMIKEYREEKFDCCSCEMWIQMLITREVFETLLEELALEMFHMK